MDSYEQFERGKKGIRSNKATVMDEGGDSDDDGTVARRAASLGLYTIRNEAKVEEVTTRGVLEPGPGRKGSALHPN